MFIYSCEKNLESILTTIYEAWNSKRGHENIKIIFEPVGQIDIFNEYIHVDKDDSKAQAVMDAINKKISQWFYSRLAYASMSHEDDVADIIYHVMILGFHYGESVLDMTNFRDIMRFEEICKGLSREVNRFQEVLRFHEISKETYVAHIEPKSKIVIALGPIFSDRMPSENFIIVDDVHREAIIHPKNEECYLKILNDEEFINSLKTEEVNDEYTDMWKVFFDTIAIKERQNTKCQNNLFPKWTRKHAVEFM